MGRKLWQRPRACDSMLHHTIHPVRRPTIESPNVERPLQHNVLRWRPGGVSPYRLNAGFTRHLHVRRCLSL